MELNPMRDATVNVTMTLFGALAAASIALGAAAADKVRPGGYPAAGVGRTGEPALPVLITRPAVALRRPDGSLAAPHFYVANRGRRSGAAIAE
jgi:hypothetical protein